MKRTFEQRKNCCKCLSNVQHFDVGEMKRTFEQWKNCCKCLSVSKLFSTFRFLYCQRWWRDEKFVCPAFINHYLTVKGKDKGVTHNRNLIIVNCANSSLHWWERLSDSFSFSRLWRHTHGRSARILCKEFPIVHCIVPEMFS